jgi:pyridoxamine 5'-phosphate oxidase
MGYLHFCENLPRIPSLPFPRRHTEPGPPSPPRFRFCSRRIRFTGFMTDQPLPAHLSLAGVRKDYFGKALEEHSASPDPILQFNAWFLEASQAGIKEPNAMTLATATASGIPSARVVLLKDVSEEGFVFYTNYKSRKAQELLENPRAALVFFWPELERQVRVEGVVHPTSRQQTEQYFKSRPRGSRLGAIASRQSAVIGSRTILEERLRELEDRYRDTDDIPVPEFWGGYSVVPHVIEFWQGRPNRLHDRLRYSREEVGPWRLERLAP